MFWFRMAFACNLIGAFIWDIGLITGILVMCVQGNEQQSMEKDPTKNGTITLYVFILLFQFMLAIAALFSFVICFRVWRNNFQLDKQLRSHFIIWFVAWVISIIGVVGVGIFAIVQGRDPQGQLGYMYEMFQRNAQQQRFVAGLERFQRDHSCCGIYGPDDWMMAQLQQQPGAAAYQAMDFGMQMNPSTGKCHMYPPVVPVGCGRIFVYEINKQVKMYAALTLVQAILAIAAAVLAWYCFFYWLEQEVMILPTDELCEIIVVEPPDENAVEEDEFEEPMGGGSQYYNNFGEEEPYYESSRRSRLPPNSQIRSFIDEHGQRRSYLIVGDRFGQSQNTARSLAHPTRRSLHGSELHGNSQSNRPNKVYLTKAQLEGLNSPMSRRSVRPNPTHGGTRRSQYPGGHENFGSGRSVARYSGLPVRSNRFSPVRENIGRHHQQSPRREFSNSNSTLSRPSASSDNDRGSRGSRDSDISFPIRVSSRITHKHGRTTESRASNSAAHHHHRTPRTSHTKISVNISGGRISRRQSRQRSSERPTSTNHHGPQSSSPPIRTQQRHHQPSHPPEPEHNNRRRHSSRSETSRAPSERSLSISSQISYDDDDDQEQRPPPQHQQQQHHGRRSTTRTHRSRSRPIQAQILFKNHQALHPTGSKFLKR